MPDRPRRPIRFRPADHQRDWGLEDEEGYDCDYDNDENDDEGAQDPQKANMSKDIELIARGVLVREGHILFCRHKKKKNYFLPGGHIKFNESAKCALQREIEEETGLKSKVGRFLGASEHTFRSGGKRFCEINLVFELHIRGTWASRPVVSAEPKLEFVWLPLRILSQCQVQPATLIRDLPDWLKNAQSCRWGSSYKTEGRQRNRIRFIGNRNPIRIRRKSAI